MTVRGPGASPVWCDGVRRDPAEATLAVGDPAVLAGVGLFETIGVRRGVVLDLPAHVERMLEGARVLEIGAPDERQIARSVGEAAGEIPNAPRGWIKIVLSGGGRWFLFRGELDPAAGEVAASAVVLPWRRSVADPISRLKSSCHATHVLGLRFARRKGADEGIWLNDRGHLAEACSANIFAVRRGALYTPDVRDGALPGIVRARVIGVARDQGLSVHVGKTRLRRLEHADEAFLTSSVRGIRPLVRFEGRPVGRGSAGALTRRLAAAVESARIGNSAAPT